MEPLRDPQYNLELFGVRIMLILAAVLFIGALTAIIILRKKHVGYLKIPVVEEKKPDIETENYERQFNITREDLEEIELSEEELEAKKLYEEMEKLEAKENDAD